MHAVREEWHCVTNNANPLAEVRTDLRTFIPSSTPKPVLIRRHQLPSHAIIAALTHRYN